MSDTPAAATPTTARRASGGRGARARAGGPAGARRRGGAAARARNTPSVITPAIVLRTFSYGEADVIAVLLTQRWGRISAIAKSAKKSRRRFGGALDLFTHVEAEVRDVQGADLFWLERVELVAGHLPLRQDVRRFAHAGAVLELARELVREREECPELFAVTVVALDWLAREGAERREPLRWFELAALDAVGLAPELERCVSCGVDAARAAGRLREPVVFDVSRGGPLCAACRKAEDAETTAAGGVVRGAARVGPLPRGPARAAGASSAPGVSSAAGRRAFASGPATRVELGAGTLAALRALSRHVPSRPLRLSLGARGDAEAALLLERFIEYQLGKRLRAPAVAAALGA